jgi:acetyl-CoA carboxylase biotin carboxyl carrier protein
MDLEYVEKLIDRLEKSELTEIRIRKGDEEVLLRKKQAIAFAPPPAYGYAPPPQAPAAPGAPAPAASKIAAGDFVTSPIVGTFYRSASPDAPAFAKEGDRVKKGQVICIIEAMKVMNQLEAEFDCEILRVACENGAAVEYGSPLFEVKRA